MKKFACIYLIICAISTSIYAQNVGIGTVTPTATLDINGDLVLRVGDITISDSMVISLDLNTVRYSNYRIWTDAPYSPIIIRGIDAGTDGRVVTLYNRTGNSDLQFNNDDTASTSGNKILTGTNADLILYAGGILTLQYDTSVQRWVVNSSNQLSATSANEPMWLLSGNSGTNTAEHFLGTTDSLPLRIRLNNLWAGELNAGTRNYFIGDSAGISTTTGIKNIGIGSKVLRNNTIGSWNTAVGAQALTQSEGGNYNAAFGFSALDSTTYGSNNSAFGTQALRFNKGGSLNTAVGVNSLYQSRYASWNTSVGAYALFHSQTGIGNATLGVFTLYSNISGNNNVAVGNSAMNSNRSGSSNTAVGTNAMYSDTSGNFNTAIGAHSLVSNKRTNSNTAIGSFALYNHKINDFSTAVGAYALYFDTSGYYNTSIGYASLYSNRKGVGNTALGHGAIYSNTTGSYNTGVGYAALVSSETGSHNTAVGDSSQYSNTIGSKNTAIGKQALYHIVGGVGNTAVGYNSGTDPGSPNTNNTVSIGNDGYLNAATNQAFMGNLSTTWIGGNVPWATYSDSRVKTNISEDVKGLDFITRLRPVTYYRSIKAMTDITGNQEVEDYPEKYDIEKIKFTGFLAQEVEKAANDAGYDFSGVTNPGKINGLYTLSYEQFVVPLVKAVQELNHKLEEKVSIVNLELAALKSDNETLKQRVEKIEAFLLIKE